MFLPHGLPRGLPAINASGMLGKDNFGSAGGDWLLGC